MKKHSRIDSYLITIQKNMYNAVPGSFYQFLGKWLPLGVLAGIAGAIAAILFEIGLRGVEEVFNALTVYSILFIILLPAAGLFIAMLVMRVFKIFHKYHGMNAVIDAFHYRRGLIEKRGWLPVLLASTISLGLGASGGPEGPVSYMSASISSTFSHIFKKILKLRKADTKIFIISSMAGGLGAIFKAPFGGALFALEVPYLNDFESSAIIPALVSGVTSYLIYTSIFGFSPVINVPVVLYSNWAVYLPYIIITGIVSGVVAILFVMVTKRTTSFFEKISKINYFLPPLIAGLMISIIGLFIPLSLQEGDAVIGKLFLGNISYIFSFQYRSSMLLFIVLALIIYLVSKLLTTSISLGTGAPLGVFYPALLLGGVTGAVIGTVFKIGYIGTDILIVAGMGSVLAGTTKTPVSSVVMMAEMVGLYVVSIPVSIAVILSFIVSGDYTANSRQIIKKGFQMDLSIIENKKVSDMCDRSVYTLPYTITIGKAQEMVGQSKQRFYAVLSDSGGVVGIVYSEVLRKIKGSLRENPLITIMESHFDYVVGDMPVVEAYSYMIDKQIATAVVVESNKKFHFTGMISLADIYREFEAMEEE